MPVKPTTMFTDAPEFRLWVQRDPESDPPYALRWQVMGGRGTLLLPRGGGTDASPAAPSGTQTQMSADDLQATRFVVVSDRSGTRNQFHLSPLSADPLAALEAGGWTTLEIDDLGSALALPQSANADLIEDTDPHDKAATRIAALESELAAAQQRVATLTRRVAELEGEIDAAGDSSAG